MKTLKINKPWGYEQLIEKNKKFMFKKLFMKKNHRCSLQYHEKKIEVVFVIQGKLKVYLKNKKRLVPRIMKSGDFLLIKPKTIHRMEGVTNSTYLEASTPELNDVIRLLDDYKRV